MPRVNNSTTDDVYAAVPEDLKRRNQWVAWQFADDSKNLQKRKKRPMDPKTGHPASVTDSETWGTFSESVSAVEKHGVDGIGFVFSSGDPYCGFDFDKVLTRVVDITVTDPEAAEVLKHLTPYGYAEESVSGTGTHVILKGKLPRHCAKRAFNGGGDFAWSVEAYDQDRFFVVTGKTQGHTPTALLDAQGAITKAWAALGLNQPGDDGDEASGTYAGDVWSSGLTDQQIIDRARRAANSEKFSALFDRGDLTYHDGDHSAADMALVALIAFWTGPDPERIDRIFRLSKCYRPKWDEYRGSVTYGAGTIGKVLRRMVVEGDSFYRAEKNGRHSNEGGTKGPNGTGPEPAPETHNSRDLLRKTFGPVSYLVPRYLPEGTSVLSGKPKIGKSWLALLLAHGVATGTDMFGERIRPPGRVLYLALEDSPRRIASRLSKIIYGPNGGELFIPDDEDFKIDLSNVEKKQTEFVPAQISSSRPLPSGCGWSQGPLTTREKDRRSSRQIAQMAVRGE